MVDRRERRWLWYFSLAVILITTVPYLVGFSRQGSDRRYTGFIFGVDDGNSYIAKMRVGMQGDWLYRSPYTYFPQNGVFAHLPLILLGKLVAGSGEHEQLVALFHLFRFVGITLYTFASYDFLAIFLKDERWRRTGTILATFGGGFGWLMLVGLKGLWGSAIPLEFYSPETFGFLMVFGLPHLACGRAFLLWGLRDYLVEPDMHPRWKLYARTALLWFAMGLMMPLTPVTGWAVIGAHVASTGIWQAWKQRTHTGADWTTWKMFLSRAVRTGLLSAPLVIYSVLAFRLDPFLQKWEGQNILTSPDFSHYLLGFAILLPFSILGVRRLLRTKPWSGWLVTGWVAVFPLLAYAPVTVQRRLPDGIWMAVIVLALGWIESSGAVVQKWSSRWIWLSYLPALFFLTGGLASAWQGNSALFRPEAEIQAFQSLNAPAEAGRVILASFRTSNQVPAWTPLHTIIGLGPESVDGLAYERRIAAFYHSETTDKERAGLLRETNSSYVFWGPEERATGSWDPHQAAYLSEVYEQGDYFIFRVNRDALRTFE